MTAPATEANVLSINELVVAVRKLTDTTLHAPDCRIDPDETHCECPIGRIRAALPKCPFILTVANEPGTTYYCVEIDHPDRPTTHTMGRL